MSATAPAMARRWRAQNVLDDQHQHEAFNLAPRRERMCTAIWSPSESALNAVQTSGWIRIACLDEHRLERLDAEAMQRGARCQRNRMLLE